MSAALRLRTGDDPHADPASSRVEQEDAARLIRSWLDALCMGLRLPERDRQQVRDELHYHLEERVRELMVTGVGEGRAAARAIGELGDAAVLARRFHAAHTAPRRRRIMNFLMVGITSAAVFGGAMVMRPTGAVINSSVFQPGEKETASLANVVIKSEGNPDISWADLFTLVGKSAGKPVAVHWSTLRNLAGDNRIGEDARVEIDFSGAESLEQMFEMMNSELNLTPTNKVEYRGDGGRLVIADTSYFDRRETKLVTYDLTDLVRVRVGDDINNHDSTQSATLEISQLIMRLVEPDNWADNGGLATATPYGAKLFIKAPKRMLAQVEWVLKEIQGAGQAGRANDDVQGRHEEADRRLTPAGSKLSVTLDRADPNQVRELLRLVLNEMPATKECDFPRSYEVDQSSRTVGVTATPRQLDLVKQLVAFVDSDIPAPADSEVGVDNFPLGHIDAESASRMVRQAVQTSPALRPRAIRILTDSRTNSLVIELPKSLEPEFVKLITLLDRDWAEPKQQASAVLTGFRNRTIPILNDIPLIGALHTQCQPTTLTIRAEGGRIRITNPAGEQIEADMVEISPDAGR
ncbi:MAG: hypothetical protein IT435_14265 [Phycisphaerales bacterium]|nr:hypothetical protein [Phycisphaerales bacterium]